MSTDQAGPGSTEPDAPEPTDATMALPGLVQDTVVIPATAAEATSGTTTPEATTREAANQASDPLVLPAPARRAGLRVGTIVWGLVIAVIGAGVIAVAAGAQLDLELTFIGLLVLAGVALLAGSIATSVRRRSR